MEAELDSDIEEGMDEGEDPDVPETDWAWMAIDEDDLDKLMLVAVCASPITPTCVQWPNWGVENFLVLRTDEYNVLISHGSHQAKTAESRS